MAKLSGRKRASEHGQAIVELALTLPLLLMVVLGIFDFGFMFQRFEVVTNAAREGARVGVLPGYRTGNTAGSTSPDAVARALAYMDTAGLGAPKITTAACSATIVANRRCATAVVEDTTLPPVGPAPAKVVKQIRVTVILDYEFVFVGPLLNVFGNGLGTARLSAVSTMRLEPD